MTKMLDQTSVEILHIEGLREADQRLEAKSLYWVNVADKADAFRWALSLKLSSSRLPLLVVDPKE
ncbi:MAG: hypothetical protein J6V64_05890, partial [Burkholderiaceae bacterium]|nr:hypothetical protein [Burkholderiaceae bacterium]